LPWTESRSRQEWLDEVKRRGERLRRRRRLSFAVVGALALMLPATALATFLAGGEDDRNVNLMVAGPPPTGEVAGGDRATGAGEPPSVAPSEETTTTTTEEDRLQAGVVDGRTEPPTPTSRPSAAPGDAPVVRTPATTPSGNSSSDPDAPVSSAPVSPPPPGAAPPTTAPGAANCPSSEVRVTVTTDRSTYAPGETVRGSTTIENRSGSACLLPTRGFVRITNAAGKDVSGLAYTMEYRFPVLAEPGKTFTTPFTWDQRDCSGGSCVQVPAGTYNVAADWTEGGQYFGRGSFTIGG
jgi:hypothetical protein